MFVVWPRDGSVAHERANAGLDVRGKFILGSGEPTETDHKVRSYDVVGGPVATLSVGPLAIIANVGAHAVVFDQASGRPVAAGGIAMAGGGGGNLLKPTRTRAGPLTVWLSAVRHWLRHLNEAASVSLRFCL